MLVATDLTEARNAPKRMNQKGPRSVGILWMSVTPMRMGKRLRMVRVERRWPSGMLNNMVNIIELVRIIWWYATVERLL